MTDKMTEVGLSPAPAPDCREVRTMSQVHLDLDLFQATIRLFPDGIGLYTIVRDDIGEPVDLRLLFLNEASTVRYPGEECPIGQTCRVLWPDMAHEGMLDEILGIAEVGDFRVGAIDWTDRSSYLPARYDWRAILVGDEVMAIVIRDDTSRFQAESDLRISLESYEAATAIEEDRRQRTITSIERIIETGDGFEIVFQPIVDLDTMRLVGVEALSRFSIEPARSPDEWFGAAAEVGLGVTMELVAVNAALRQLRHLPPDTFISVNCSPATLLEPSLLDALASSSHQVVVELTEHAHVDDYERLNDAISRVRSTGAVIAVDDTGSGYASLQHIHQVRPEHLKMDRYFVDGIHADPVRVALAAALVRLSDDMGMILIAEGIETAADLKQVRGLGIHYGQGFYLAKPGALPVEHDAFAHL